MPRVKHERDIKVNTFVIDRGGPMCCMDTLAHRLKTARELRGWTQHQLAKEAGVSQSMIGNAESGLRTAPNRLPDLADALGVRYRWLRTGDGPMTAEPVSWPFGDVSQKDFEDLMPDQKVEIRGVLRKLIADFKEANSKPNAAAA